MNSLTIDEQVLQSIEDEMEMELANALPRASMPPLPSEDMRNRQELSDVYASLITYLPASVVMYLSQAPESLPLPLIQSYETAVLFADVSGFTALSEHLSLTEGNEGAGSLAHHLNSYLAQIVKCIASQGGDVFKFAGDAMVVLWPPDSGDLETRVRKATQSAIEIQRKLTDTKLAEEVILNVKIGIGVGLCSIVLVGGVRKRIEYFATGDPLDQAFQAESRAESGDIVLSPKAWSLVGSFFKVNKELSDGFVSPGAALPGKQLHRTNISQITSVEDFSDYALELIKNCVPGSVQSFLNTPMERWISELRRVAVLFINVGISEAEMVSISTQQQRQALERVHNVVRVVQSCVYKFEGSLNKFMFDDKGSTLLAAFGLPPLAHNDDSLRAVLAALDIFRELGKLGLDPSIGVTTGTAFCGVIGAQTRKEYSVLGDVVNLSARLMQNAKKTRAGVLCDNETQYLSQYKVRYQELDPIYVKGKKNKVKIFQPTNQGNFGLKGKDIAARTIQTGFGDLLPVDSPKKSNSFGKISEFINQFRRSSSKNLGVASKRSSMFEIGKKKSIDTTKVRRARSGVDLSRESVSSHEDDGIVSDSPMGSFKLRSRSHFGGNSALEIFAHMDTDSEYVQSSPSSKSSKNYNEARIVSSFLSRAPVSPSHEEPMPSWILQALVQLPKDFKGPKEVKVPVKGSIKQLKHQVLKMCAGSFPANVPAKDFVLSIRHSKYQLLDEELRVDTIPVYFDEVSLQANREIDLELIHKSKIENAPNDGREEVRKIFAHCVHDLLQERQRNVIMLEAGMGYGKTKLISSTLCDAPVLVCCTTATSIGVQPLEAFVDLIIQMMDFDLAIHYQNQVQAGTNEDSDFDVDGILNNEERARQHRDYLIQRLEDNEEVGDRISCLNQLFDFGFEESKDSLLITKDERIQVCMDIIIAVFQIFTLLNPLMLIFDDASYLDDLSWNLVFRICKEVDSVLVVITTLPMNISYIGTNDYKVPEAYSGILSLAYTHVIKLNPIPNRIVYNIALRQLEVESIPDELAQLLLMRSKGNGLVCRELLYKLRSEGMITVHKQKSGNEPGYVTLSPSFCQEEVPVPVSMMNMLGTRLERLSKTQQLILKIASCIGSLFSKNLLQSVYPLPESPANIERSLILLEDWKIIQKLPDVKSQYENVEEHGWGKDTIYEFCDGFMKEVVKSRVLPKLYKPIETAIRKLDLEMQKKRKSRMGTNSKEIITDWFLVSKTSRPSNPSFKKKYQTRYARLSSAELILSNKESDKVPWRVIYLIEGAVEIFDAHPDECGKDNTVCIVSSDWEKGSSVSNGKKVYFYLAFADKHQMRQWKLKLQKRISAAE